MPYEPRQTTTYRFDIYATDREDCEIDASLSSVTLDTDDLQDARVIERMDSTANAYPGLSVWSTLWRISTNGSQHCLQTSIFERE